MSVEGVDATEAAVVAAMLASDNIPDENQSANCLSCGAAMKGLHCVDCGQKNDNYRRSIFSLIADLFGSVFSVESRIWRSWLALLFKPGRVAREFADGRRMYWSSPIRVYLAISIILFGFMTWTGTHLVSLDVNATIKAGVDKPCEDLTSDDITTEWDVLFFETQSAIDKRNNSRDFSLIETWLSGNFVDLQNNADEVRKNLEADEVPPEIIDQLPQLGLQKNSGEDGTQLFYNGRQMGSDEVQSLLIGFIKNPAMTTDSFNKWLPRLMFLMMPFTMLFGALFIRDKKKALLFDHLVHAAYIHAVAFFLLFAGIILSKLIPGANVFQAIFIGLLVYLPLSLKRMFGRGWFKTLFTSYTVGFIYLLVTAMAMISLMILDLDLAVGA